MVGMQKRIGKSVRHDVKQGVTLAWLFSMLLLFAACSQRQMQPPVEPETLIQFETNSITGMNDLDGTVVSGTIQITVTEGRNIKEVRFFLDDPKGSGTPAGGDGVAWVWWTPKRLSYHAQPERCSHAKESSPIS
jgi:hypothetical protein